MGAGTAQAAGEPPVFRAEGSAPILVVTTKYDPATPYEWGVEVASELDNAMLLTYEGDGHTAYTSGSSCIDKAVDAYFLDGRCRRGHGVPARPGQREHRCIAGYPTPRFELRVGPLSLGDRWTIASQGPHRSARGRPGGPGAAVTGH